MNRASAKEKLSVGSSDDPHSVGARGRKFETLWRMVLATAIVFIPPLIFEKYTYYLYVIADPNFFNFSGSRLWFDVVWFAAGGVLSTIIVGRERKVSILPSLLAALAFIIACNFTPFCDVKECYVSSTDGITPLRDFLLLGSLGVITSATSLRKWHTDNSRKGLDVAFQLGIVTLLGFALSFFPVTHIFAGVSVPYFLNYVQWFLAGAPAGFAGSMIILDRGNLSRPSAVIFSGISGVIIALALSANMLPCEDCNNPALSLASIVLLVVVSTLPALVFSSKIERYRKRGTPLPNVYRIVLSSATSTAIIIAIIIMVVFYFIPGYQASVVNSFPGVSNSSFSPLEIGRTFVYSAGYYAVPRVTSKSVGVNISFGKTILDQTKFPNDFLAAGIGDQSPNCCKDGLDLAYRADVIQFSNGTEALLARGWWACDNNMACGGYSCNNYCTSV